MSAVATPGEQRFLMRNIGWNEYRSIADAIGERHVRLTYDRGKLEFMTISHGHEAWGELLGQFIEVLTEELDMPRQSGGSNTLDREDADRGLEPDRCYYLVNEPAVRGKDVIDLEVDPPPDLALEIDITRSSLNRMGIYAAIKVPEVWRFDGSALKVYQLTADGDYIEAERSRFFSFLVIADLQAFLLKRGQMDETRLVKSFREWVREQISKGWKNSP
jgi:Uma2 family endonuclease